MLDSKRGENWEWSRHKVWRIIHEWADTRKPEKEPGEFGSYTFWVRVLRSLDQYKGDFTWPEE
jgi:hypothetical protein